MVPTKNVNQMETVAIVEVKFGESLKSVLKGSFFKNIGNMMMTHFVCGSVTDIDCRISKLITDYYTPKPSVRRSSMSSMLK